MCPNRSTLIINFAVGSSSSLRIPYFIAVVVTSPVITNVAMCVQ